MKTSILIALFVCCISAAAQQQPFSFAQITDLHVGGATGAEDLRRTVKDINQIDSISFVVATGDITEFGSDSELLLAKQILDSLQKPWYIVPGNHDNNWSESGTNSFLKIFGAETFAFSHGGYYFLGNNCGPMMRMSPGQVPYEHIVWMDSVLNTIPAGAPIIFINHYPLDSSLNNWYEVTDRLKKHNIQMAMCGHFHQNRVMNWDGIPGVVGRSVLRAKDTTGGYNIITIKNGKAFYNTKKTLANETEHWATIDLKNYSFKNDITQYLRPSYEVNKAFPQVKEIWRHQLKSDVGSGFALKNNLMITPDTKGNVYAFDLVKNQLKWTFQTGGKIYSTPAIAANSVVVTSTDGNVYSLSLQTGKLLWKYTTHSPIVASPVIVGNAVYTGSSNGKFRSINLHNGRQNWVYDSVKSFVASRPVYDNGTLYFGSWGNEFYALNANTGREVWKFKDGYTNRMYSPASCVPVVCGNKVFFVAPDRSLSVLNKATGKLLHKKKWEKDWVRESMGISADKKLVFAKTMQGDVIGVPADADSPEYAWKTNYSLGYELNPAPVSEHNNLVFALSDKGMVAAYQRKTGNVAWVHKVSNTLVNMIQPLSKNLYVLTTMDGKIIILEEKK